MPSLIFHHIPYALDTSTQGENTLFKTCTQALITKCYELLFAFLFKLRHNAKHTSKTG